MVFSAITKIRNGILSLLAVLLFSAAPAAGSDAIGEATAILERWTSFHWGRDCLVWIVHYPEELVDPWVESEAARGGMSDGEREEYRKAFVSELRIADTEPFLVTVYAFGPRPLCSSRRRAGASPLRLLNFQLLQYRIFQQFLFNGLFVFKPAKLQELNGLLQLRRH